VSVVKINAITASRERLDEFARCFASRAGRVEAARGFGLDLGYYLVVADLGP
jgi:heme-degrading monooxygenase HmoA